MMGQLLECGPLAAIVDAVSWQDYQGGIIQHHCSSQHSNHAVLIVGYDTTGTFCHHTGVRQNLGTKVFHSTYLQYILYITCLATV